MRNFSRRCVSGSYSQPNKFPRRNGRSGYSSRAFNATLITDWFPRCSFNAFFTSSSSFLQASFNGGSISTLTTSSR